jgi:hypothetical protein
MKKALILVWVCGVGLLLAQGDQRGTARVSLGDAKIEVDYGRPLLKGRDWSGVEVGTVWRLGANKATTLTTDRNLTIDGVAVPPGTYALLAKKVGPDSWELVINKDPNVAGNQRDLDLDLASVPMTASRLSKSVEQLTIRFQKTAQERATMYVEWGESALASHIIAVSGLPEGS